MNGLGVIGPDDDDDDDRGRCEGCGRLTAFDGGEDRDGLDLCSNCSRKRTVGRWAL